MTRAARRRRLLLVGGAGRMGRRLAPFFSRRGFQVEVSDPAGAPRGRRAVPLGAAADADVVVVAASLAQIGEAMEAVVDLSPRGLLFDIASVKAPLLPAFRRARKLGLSATSAHPMFGPTVRSFRGLDLILCDAGDPAATRRAGRLFQGAGLHIRTMPIEAHDPWIARTLGLAHFVALAAGSTMAGLDVDLKASGGQTSTSFRRLLSLVGSIAEQDLELTRMIQTANPEGEAVVDKLVEEIEAWRDHLFRDADGLAEKLERVRGWYRDGP